MAAEASRLLETYAKGAESTYATSVEFHQEILDYKPKWENHEATRSFARELNQLKAGAPASDTKAVIQSDPGILKACMAAMDLPEDKPMQWVLTLLYDSIREDSSCYGLFEEAMKNQVHFYKPITSLLGRQKLDAYVADKAAWLLSAVIGHLPRYFSEDEVKDFTGHLLKSSNCTDLGVLEAITNLLKSDEFRGLVWSQPGVHERIFRIDARAAPSPILYKFVFALWMLSFDAKITTELKNLKVITKIKEVLTTSRAEKVVRLCLTLLGNLLVHKDLCEDIVEEGVLEAVQQLEYEKWRDTDLYEEIRDMQAKISSEVNEMSNFDRYEREIQTGQLHWGFIHSHKFWAENVLKFESNDFRALKMLTQLLQSKEETTLAVACHDLGEFVAMHPLGKKKVSQMGIKERVMELMGAQDTGKEVRREALLCCQKIMLNKWQDMDA